MVLLDWITRDRTPIKTEIKRVLAGIRQTAGVEVDLTNKQESTRNPK